MTIAGILLAAGEGRRFGGPKALVSYGDELLVERGARMLRDAGCDPVVVVLGAFADEVVARAQLGSALVVVNDGWAEGIGSSLRAGLDAVSASAAEGCVVALVDQPRVTAPVVRRLVDAREKARAVVASYGGQSRNPVLLDRAIWSGVHDRASGDVGARAWLRENPADVLAVACDDLGSDIDIDTPADLDRLVEET